MLLSQRHLHTPEPQARRPLQELHSIVPRETYSTTFPSFLVACCQRGRKCIDHRLQERVSHSFARWFFIACCYNVRLFHAVWLSYAREILRFIMWLIILCLVCDLCLSLRSFVYNHSLTYLVMHACYCTHIFFSPPPRCM